MTTRLRSVLRNPFSFLFASTGKEERVAAYVIREHGRGRDLADILEDPYIRNRLTPQERARILDRPDVIHAIGEQMVSSARGTLPTP